MGAEFNSYFEMVQISEMKFQERFSINNAIPDTSKPVLRIHTSVQRAVFERLLSDHYIIFNSSFWRRRLRRGLMMT